MRDGFGFGLGSHPIQVRTLSGVVYLIDPSSFNVFLTREERWCFPACWPVARSPLARRSPPCRFSSYR